MGIIRTVAHNIKLTSDLGRVYGGGIAGIRARATDAERLKVCFLAGNKIAKMFNFPNLYRENNELKRTGERIGKALFELDGKNLISVSGEGITWEPSAFLESGISRGGLILKNIEDRLPDSLFAVRKTDGKIDEEHYAGILEQSSSAFSVRTTLRPLATLRAHGSLAGFEAKNALIKEVSDDGLPELIPVNFKDFEGPVVLGNDCLKIFFSDTHAGGGGPADDFEPNKELFNKLLDQLEHVILPRAKENGIPVKLLVLGDAAERWQFEWDEIYRNNKDILNRLLGLGVDIYYVAGNHDMDAGAYFNKKAELPGGSSIYITDMVRDPDGIFVHGHMADPFNSTTDPSDVEHKPFGAYVTKLAKYLEYIDPNIEEKFDALKKAFTSGKFDETYTMHFINYIDGLKKKFFPDDKAFRAILGHTHKVDKGNENTTIGQYYAGSLFKKTMYFNTGTAGGAKPPLFWGIKNREGDVEIVQIGAGPVIRPFA